MKPCYTARGIAGRNMGGKGCDAKGIFKNNLPVPICQVIPYSIRNVEFLLSIPADPSGLVLNLIEIHEIIDKFEEYLRKTEIKFLVFAHKKKPEAVLISAKCGSRYFKEGRKRLKKRIRKRLKRVKLKKCVLLTLTYDPKLITIKEAWERYGRHVRDLLNAINELRRRRGFKRRLIYLWVVEQHKNGYPHVHIVFPGLKFLVEKERIARLWGWGFIRVEQARDVGDVIGYVLKYVTKLEGWNRLGLAMLKRFRGYLYRLSRFFYLKSKTVSKSESEWYLWNIEEREDFQEILESLGMFFDRVKVVLGFDR